MERMYIITDDIDKAYEPNTEISGESLVKEYIDGLCLNEPNDKECADWLTSMLEKDTDYSVNQAVRFVSIMWGLDIIAKDMATKVKYVDELKEIIKRNNSLNVKMEDKQRQMLKEFLKNEFVLDLKKRAFIHFKPSLVVPCLWDKDNETLYMKKCYYYDAINWLEMNGFSVKLNASQIENISSNEIVELIVKMD